MIDQKDVTRTPTKDLISKTHYLVENAIKKQLVSDVPVGTFLSGGLDSSAVTYFAKKHYQKTLSSYTIQLDGEAFRSEGFIDDYPYAQQASGFIGCDLKSISVGPDCIDQLTKLIYHLDEPQADPAPINLYFICKLAKEQGIKVLLSGAGGDDIFTGYRRHLALMNEKYLNILPFYLKNGIKNIFSDLPARNSIIRRLKKLFEYTDLSGNEKIASYFNWINLKNQNSLYVDDFLNSLDDQSQTSPLSDSLNILPPDVHPLNKMLYLELKHFLCDHNLNYTDKMSMACGVEVRVPLLDKELVEFAFTLPPVLKQNGACGKWIFKKAMEPFLPHSLIYRKKTGFGAPLRYWMNNQLKDLSHELLSETTIKNRGIFNYTNIRKLRTMTEKNLIDETYPLFSLMCIELWFRIFVDKSISV